MDEKKRLILRHLWKEVRIFAMPVWNQLFCEPLKTKPTKLILVVDDDPQILRLVEMILTAEGLPCVTASSVEEACVVLKENRDIGLVLSDWELETSGAEVVRFCRELFPFMPVIVMSATSLNLRDVKAEALMAGADSFLEKPLDVPVLVNHVKRWLKRISKVVPAAGNPVCP